MSFGGTGHRLGSEWGSDFSGQDSRPVDLDLIGQQQQRPDTASSSSAVPSLREICISTLDRYVDCKQKILFCADPEMLDFLILPEEYKLTSSFTYFYPYPSSTGRPRNNTVLLDRKCTQEMQW